MNRRKDKRFIVLMSYNEIQLINKKNWLNDIHNLINLKNTMSNQKEKKDTKYAYYLILLTGNSRIGKTV